MHLTDSHCHLDGYDADALPAVLSRAEAAGVRTLLAIGIGDGPATMHRALDLARSHPHIYATAGIHPQEAGSATPEGLAKLSLLAADPRCLAIGEIGLDYYHADNPSIPTQEAAFIAQMSIAATAGKHIIIHCRTSEAATPAAKEKFGTADAWDDLLHLLSLHWPVAAGGIMHCFSGTQAHAERSLAAGFHISFAGNLTYPKSTHLREAATLIPADRLLIETDAPFLAPIPHRGTQNEPALITHTAEALATLRGISLADLAALTTANFQRLFHLQ